jgi:SulP family sulfate permease
MSARRDEFAIAVLAAVAVVVLGAGDGIVLAVVASIIDHLRHTYHPRNSVLVKSPSGHWHPIPVRPGARTEDGLAVYRFGTDLYYANAPRLADDVRALTGRGGPLRWLVLDSAAIGDVDYTAGSVLIQVIEQLHQRHIRFVVTSMLSPVRRQLDRYGVGGPSGPDAYFETPGEALEAFHAAQARQRPARASDR